MINIDKGDQGIIRKIIKAAKVKNFSEGAKKGKAAAKKQGKKK